MSVLIRERKGEDTETRGEARMNTESGMESCGHKPRSVRGHQKLEEEAR